MATATPTFYSVEAGGTIYGGRVNPDGTTWDGGQGAAYKGNETFNSLQAVFNGISSSGGWAQLSGTTLQSAFPSQAQIDAIAPSNCLRQNQWPNNWMVWGSAAFNGYGWFTTTPGGHFAGYMNDTYVLRVADPVGAVRMHMPSPLSAVVLRSGGTIVNPANWWQQAAENIVSFTEWGPVGCHQYSGCFWDATTEKMIFGGDAQGYVQNPEAIGEVAATVPAIYVFDPYEATPKRAWKRMDAPTSGHKTGFGMVRHSDGKIAFRNLAQPGGTRFKVDIGALSVSSASVSTPIAENYTAWRHAARDPATDKFYELHEPTLGSGSNATALYETTSGGYVKVANVPSNRFWQSSQYQDEQSAILIVNSKAYIIGQAAAGSSSTVRLAVTQIDLSNGAVQSFYDATGMYIPEGLYEGTTVAGLHGRVGYVPQVGCFVAFPSARDNVWVFRPPAAWGV